MNDIADLFINMFTDESKPPTNSITDTALKYKKTKSKNKNTPALNQGDKFLFYQSKISKNLAKENQISNDMFSEGVSEGFHGRKHGLTGQSRKMLRNTNMTSEEQYIISLQNQYKDSLAKYEIMLAKIAGQSNKYVDRVNPNNPYLNKNIRIGEYAIMYVTNQGIAKVYLGWDTFINTAGIHGCPAQTEIIQIPGVPWDEKYKRPGEIIPSTPPLLTGTPMTSGQACGKEGTNVFVNEMVSSDVSASYAGVYNTSSSMTSVGGSPPVMTKVQIQNGNFDVPALTNNSGIYIGDSTSVPGWTSTTTSAEYDNGGRAFLMNQWDVWGYPTYPNGPQAVNLQRLGGISQVVQLSPGTYTISFMACGRNCCDGTGLSNYINVKLNGNIIYTAQPTINVWSRFTTPVTVTTGGANIIRFVGTCDFADRSSAIQNIQLSVGSLTPSGTYTFDMCKQAAINNGNQYFGLQDVNTSTSTGYCGVTNDYIGATQRGTSIVALSQKALWSSNTSTLTTNSAALNNSGALCVYDSSGKAIYSSPNSSAQPGNYYGCYGDTPDRAMPLYNGGSQQYDLAQCSDIAKQNNYGLFGLQNSMSGTNAQCALSNDFGHSIKYGIAKNCTKIGDGTYTGGGWSNAMYNTLAPAVNYFLILQDDGNMCIYRGFSPSDNQGNIWCSYTQGQQQDANPAFAASAGKYGRNYITAGGETLAPGEFVGSTSGDMALVMQSDGNLVLYTWTMGQNSQTLADGNTGGGQGATALYKLSDVGIPSNLTKLGYVDENAELNTYPTGNTKLLDAYTKVPNTNSGSSNIQENGVNIEYGNASVEDCTKTCNSRDDCYGFVTSSTGMCYPKNSTMNPSYIDDMFDSYTRNQAPKTVPPGASDMVNNIDTVSYQNYTKGRGLANEYGLVNALNQSNAELSQMEVKLNALANEISSLTGKFETNNTSVGKQIKTNIIGSNDYLSKLQQTKNSIQTIQNTAAPGLHNILENSDIVVLQKNYEYLFWSVLAVGVVLVSVNVVKNK